MSPLEALVRLGAALAKVIPSVLRKKPTLDAPLPPSNTAAVRQQADAARAERQARHGRKPP